MRGSWAGSSRCREVGGGAAVKERPHGSQPKFRVNGIDMTGYMVKDTARALTFYRTVLGLEPTTVYSDEKGADTSSPTARPSGYSTAGTTCRFCAGSGVMFAVDDFDAAVSEAQAQGAPILMQFESPVCFMAGTQVYSKAIRSCSRSARCQA